MARVKLRTRKQRWLRQPKRETWASRVLGLATLERQTLPARAARLIRGRILAGDVRPGQRLESLRLLARELGVSLPTAREAIAELRGEGLVEVRHGVGCFVARRPRVARTLKTAARRATRREVAELRAVVEPAVAGAAARRASSAGVRELAFATWELAAARRSGDPDAFTDADLTFHRAVAAAARGQIGAAAYRLVAGALRPQLRANAASLADDQRLADLHRALSEAVERRRPTHAARAARAIALIETQPPRAP